jgi:hypothetical protein
VQAVEDEAPRLTSDEQAGIDAALESYRQGRVVDAERARDIINAAVDPRVAAAVAERAVQGFGWALDHGAWDSRAWTFRDALEAAAGESKAAVNAAFVKQFYDRVAPGIYGRFDAPAMLPLAAPRPMLAINGDSDPRTPMAGVRESAAAAERAYKAAGASGKFVLKVIPNLGHENTPEIDQAMVDWFVKWLNP